MTTCWLVFRSHPKCSPWPATILDIARASERNNAASGVSGMMLFSNDIYLQLLEGSAEKLCRLWDSIRRDDRHAIEWVERGKAPAQLTGLPMGYFDLDRERRETGAQYTQQNRKTWTASRVNLLRDMLIDVGYEKYPSTLGLDSQSFCPIPQYKQG